MAQAPFTLQTWLDAWPDGLAGYSWKVTILNIAQILVKREHPDAETFNRAARYLVNGACTCKDKFLGDWLDESVETLKADEDARLKGINWNDFNALCHSDEE